MFVDPKQHVGVALLWGAHDAANVLIHPQRSDHGILAAFYALVIETSTSRVVAKLGNKGSGLAAPLFRQLVERLEEVAGEGNGEAGLAHGMGAVAGVCKASMMLAAVMSTALRSGGSSIDQQRQPAASKQGH